MTATLRGAWPVFRAACLTLSALCLPLSPCALAQSPLPDSFNPGANSNVLAVAVQPDGKILVGGTFTNLSGQPRSFIGRLNADGSVDSEFNPGADNFVYSLAVQEDGKILVGGIFNTLGGQPQGFLGRLNADGTVDSDFNPVAGGMVRSLEVQADGRILVGGAFVTLGGQSHQRLGRLHADGSLDGSFNAAANNFVFALTALPDGKILVGGQFTNLNGQARWRIARLEADGTLDTGFTAEANGVVRTLVVQTDGKILLGGSFATLGGQPRNCIGRLNADGTLDNDFSPGANGTVFSLAVQVDGKILAGGDFTQAGGQMRNRLARFHADGTLDEDFNPGASRTVTALALQPDGKILVGGAFVALGGQPRKHIARLNNTQPATQSLVHDGSTITWLRSGNSPEVSRTAFDYSADGFTWFSLGAGERISGGWQVSVIPLPSPVTLRARGWVAGDNIGSRWLVETHGGNIVLLTQPASRTNIAATMTTFTVSAIGGEPLFYQWWKEGAPLEDGGNIAGAMTSTLTLSNLLEAAEGGYSVVVSNSFGTVTSQVATLTVIDPVIASEPVSRQRNVGNSVAFNVVAEGTALTYQWLKDGSVLIDDGRVAGAATPTLILASVLKADEGGYSVVVGNLFGSVTSRVAVLTVVDPAITNHPAGLTRNAGDTAAFTVAVAGVALTYQWLKDGNALSDGENVNGTGTPALTISSLLAADAGGYSVVIANASGSATSQVATLTVIDPVIVSQTTNQTRNLGESVTFEVMAAGTAPLSYHWWKDGAPLASGSTSALTLTNVQYADAGNYSMVVSNAHGTATSAVARLTVNLVALDNGFNPLLVTLSGIFTISALTQQPDGKIVTGGDLETVLGQAHRYIHRFNAGGTLDSGFNPGANFFVHALAIQADGRILVGGRFTTLNGAPRGFLGRLDANGQLDGEFNPSADGYVYSLAVQADGKIVVGGNFTTMGGQPHRNVARLNANGTPDGAFNAAATRLTNSGEVAALALQPDGQILIGGEFDTVSGQPRTNIARLNADGTLDDSFNAAANGANSSPPTDGRVNVLALQADGKILLGGQFYRLNGEPRNYFGRLNADGTRDISFNPGVDGRVHALALQADGRVLLGGEFSRLNGQTTPNFGRLNGDGTLDQGFKPPQVNRFLYAMALQADGKILVAGEASGSGGLVRSNIVRFTLFEPATQGLSYDGSSVTWLRGGTSPEVWRTTFDYSLDGTNWFGVGEGTRIAGGWRIADVSLPLTVSLRARGHVVGGSPWMAETVVLTNAYVGAPFLVTQPVSRTNIAGSVVTFGVLPVGTQPLAYQWSKDGAPLVDGGRVAGATAAILTVNNVVMADEGGYSVIVSNADGSVTSRVASLTVLDPAIASQPSSQQRNAGQSVTLSVQAAGTALTYQWLKDGSALADDGRITGAATAALTVRDLLKTDEGGYSVVVTGAHGSVTSQVATLTVVDPVITGHPSSQSRNQGESATLSVVAAGTAPFSYQWLKNGVALPESTGADLALVNLQLANSGNYSVVAGNTYGNVTSSVATLTVIELAITLQPLSQKQNAGESAIFTVAAAGVELSYQWFRGDMPLTNSAKFSGATTTTLIVSNLLNADEGGYSVVASSTVGSVTSQVATLIVIDPVITSHPTYQSRNPGESVTFNVTAAGTHPISHQWWKDGETLPQGTGPVLSLTNLQEGDLGGYSVVVANSYGSATSHVAQLVFNYTTLETAFEPGTQVSITAAAVQPDGKILIGGYFSIPDVLPRQNLARFHANGFLDGSFRMENAYTVSSLVVQPDGKILVGGASIRLNPDGTRDTNFSAARSFSTAMAVLPDGEIVTFIQTPQPQTYPRLSVVQLNLDGSFDRTLVGGEFWLYVKSIVVLNSGNIIMAGGDFLCCGLSDYTIGPGQVRAAVDSMIAETDGKTYLSGALGAVNGMAVGNFVRLTAGGGVDTSFTPPGSATAKVVQMDGKVIVSSGFNWPDGGRRPYSRLNTNGTLDESLDLGDYVVHSLLPDGRILAGHWTTNSEGLGLYRLARLTNTEPATESLTYDGSTITWLRGGTSPEVWYASFDYSVNGRDWYSIGTGQLIQGGWRLTNAPPGIPGTIRARGLVAMGALRSHWVVEAFTEGTEVGFITHPVGQTKNAGTAATFSAFATGEAPLAYQWQKDGVPLVDGGNILGTATPSLTVSNLLKPDEGGYSVAISNVAGSVTSRVARLTVRDPAINVQPLSQNRNPGEIVTFTVTAAGTAPLSYQWRAHGAPVPDGTDSTLTLTNLQSSDAGDYTVVVGNQYDSVTSTVAQLTVNLVTIDEQFSPSIAHTSPGGWVVRSFAIQADSKILVGGAFSTLGGQPRNNLGRLNADGTVDAGFNPGAAGTLYALAVQADGKILAAGDFTMLGGQPRKHLGRLNADGTLDEEFNPAPSGPVYSLAVQPDGKILVGGTFTNLAGQPRQRIGRLNSDGTADSGFNPGANDTVYALTQQSDGKILVGGNFTVLGGVMRSRIGRLNANGMLDEGFNPGANALVRTLVVRPDGKIMVGGQFAILSGQARSGIGRLNANGTLDAAFDPRTLGTSGADVISLALQTDGKVLAGGWFTALGGQSRYFIARLNADGGADSSFNPGAGHAVLSLAIQADGKILAGGLDITWVGGPAHKGIGRLNNTEPATQSLSRSDSTIMWLRGGASPEVWRTTFEYSTDRLNWTSLGAGTRIPGGWTLTNVAAPSDAHIRARGFLTGGFANGSSWIVEAYSGFPPALFLQPASRTNQAGTSVTFGVSAGWTDPLSYRWMKDGVPLTDVGNVSGAATPRLTIANLLKPDEGGYSVVVSNAQGTITSQTAWLRVIDPAITNPPLNQHRNVGESVTFSVTASGTSPLTYQWWKQGVAGPLGNASTLTLSELQLVDAGYYTVVVGNGYGSVTSAVAQLTMNLVMPDSSFTPGITGVVQTVAIQPSEKILAGGNFEPMVGQTRRRIGLLNTDGTLDSAFNPLTNGEVTSLALQADGKILVGGSFTSLGGRPRKYIGRLNDDGTLDEAFDPSAGGGSVLSLVVQADAKILAGGSFTALAGSPRRGIARLNADGTMDPGFSTELSGSVFSMAVQGDGRILVGGQFTSPGAQPRTNLARLHVDGALDTSFNAPANGYVTAFAVQPDGKIVLGGYFTTLNGQPCKRIGRLNADGTLDTEFNPEANDSVYAVAIQEDGQILVGGYFTMLAGQPHNYFARLSSIEPATQTLSHNGSTIHWLRGGSSPEVWRTTFDYSTDGLTWASLGDGTRIPGGWQLHGSTVPPGVTIRARGHVAGGYGNSSGWFVETLDQSTAPMLVAGEGRFGLLSNRFEFQILGLPGQSVVVEVSTNLFDWSPIQTNTVGAAPLHFTDPDWLLWPQRFYRVRTE